ncbi:NAD(P)/FAD-dependent oxidoreductase [Tropicibacter oceani]|uniref:FAD-binding oxidoreductase n=1 Tax=Tropicibacter oceani TaxID=3058420 RepID=A0ABY8QJE3_9RHOB|nr:FAD-binding oxidoreductase [Tropicibacter oceani]WGW04744.1 FAD-binding oxidoreductase [Tropicibacter oceani]
MTVYRAKRLPQQRGPAAWNAILGPQPAGRILKDAQRADFTIIGAGFAGLSAARRLLQLQPDAKVAVLEAGRVAEGAAGRNSGFMIDLPHELTSADYAGAGDDRAVIALNRQAIGFARAAVQDYAIDPAYFDECGKVNGAVSEAAQGHNRSYARHLETLGEGFEHLDAAQMRDMTGSDYYRSGLFTPGTVMLQPAGYIRGLAAGLSRDVAIYEQSPVTALTRVGPDWRVDTPRGSITCPRVILANNGHLESFGFERGRLMHLFLFASMTAELTSDQVGQLGGQPRWGITPSDPMGTTMRRIDSGQGGNRIVTRSCAVLRSGMETRPRDLTRAARVHRQKFDARFAQLAGTPMQYQWAGHLCLSLNAVSVMRELEPGLFSACVQNGLGTARGTLTGIGAAELACGHTSTITRHFGAAPAPAKLPPSPLRDPGANAVLRWKEWKAGAE